MNKTKIEWADATWNPITGCTKISPGCQNCYAERMSKRLAGRCGYPADEPFKVTLHPDKLNEPLKWKKPKRVFVCSMSDLFHEDVPDRFLIRIWDVMGASPWHKFLILTKRPQRMKDFVGKLLATYYNLCGPTKAKFSLKENDFYKQHLPLPNVWLGVTAEDQARADERIPILLQIPAAVRFVSYEPALGPVDFSPWIKRYYHGGVPGLNEKLLPPSITGKSTLLQYAKEIAPDGEQRADRVYFTTDPKTAELFTLTIPRGVVYRAIPDLPIEPDPDCLEPGLSYQAPSATIVPWNTPVLDWVIAGGESGPGARPCHPDWIRSVRDQCQGAGVPFFFKQWGEWGFEPYPKRGNDPYKSVTLDGQIMFRCGKKAAGRLLDGREWNEFPQ